MVIDASLPTSPKPEEQQHWETAETMFYTAAVDLTRLFQRFLSEPPAHLKCGHMTAGHIHKDLSLASSSSEVLDELRSSVEGSAHGWFPAGSRTFSSRGEVACSLQGP